MGFLLLQPCFSERLKVELIRAQTRYRLLPPFLVVWLEFYKIVGVHLLGKSFSPRNLTFSPDLTATQSSHGFPRLSKHLTSISSPLQIMKVGGGFKRNYGIMLQQRGRGRCLSFLDNSVGRDRFPFLPIVSNNRIIGDQNVCWWGFSRAELCGQFKYQLRETSEYGNTLF